MMRIGSSRARTSMSFNQETKLSLSLLCTADRQVLGESSHAAYCPLGRRRRPVSPLSFVMAGRGPLESKTEHARKLAAVSKARKLLCRRKLVCIRFLCGHQGESSHVERPNALSSTQRLRSPFHPSAKRVGDFSPCPVIKLRGA